MFKLPICDTNSKNCWSNTSVGIGWFDMGSWLQETWFILSKKKKKISFVTMKKTINSFFTNQFQQIPKLIPTRLKCD